MSIEIKIDPTVLEQAVTKAVTEGLTRGVGHYDITNAITTACTEAVKSSDLVGVVNRKLDELLRSRLDALVDQVLAGAGPAVVAGLVRAYRDATVDLLVKMRNTGRYMGEEELRKLRAEVVAEMDRDTAAKDVTP